MQPHKNVYPNKCSFWKRRFFKYDSYTTKQYFLISYLSLLCIENFQTNSTWKYIVFKN